MLAKHGIKIGRISKGFRRLALPRWWNELALSLLDACPNSKEEVTKLTKRRLAELVVLPHWRSVEELGEKKFGGRMAFLEAFGLNRVNAQRNQKKEQGIDPHRIFTATTFVLRQSLGDVIFPRREGVVAACVVDLLFDLARWIKRDRLNPPTLEYVECVRRAMTHRHSLALCKPSLPNANKMLNELCGDVAISLQDFGKHWTIKQPLKVIDVFKEWSDPYAVMRITLPNNWDIDA